MAKTVKKLSASLEDYLEAIYWIVDQKGAARGRDLARRLNVKAASVTGALQTLVQRGLIHYAPYEVITLTDAGKEQAKKVIRRHEVLKDFFTRILCADEDLAEDAACKLEHGIPKDIVDRLVSFTEFAQSCPRAGLDWLDQFKKHCLQGKELECHVCLPNCAERFKKQNRKTNTKQPPLNLTQINPGQRCMVRSVRHSRTVTKRLVEMGVGRGAIIEVERVAPLGDPLEIKVKGYHLSIRQEEARSIEVVKQ
jgi:DtxR family transcriptional regulator, Mn-dependent transcriptional regulator